MECFLSFFFMTRRMGKKKVSGGLEKRRQKQVASIKPRWKKKKKKLLFLTSLLLSLLSCFLWEAWWENDAGKLRPCAVWLASCKQGSVQTGARLPRFVPFN